MRTKTVVALVVCGLSMAPTMVGQPPQAQEKQGGPPRLGPLAQQLVGEDWEKRDVQELVELVMMVRLSRTLDLSEERTVVMVRRFQEFKERLIEVNKERQGALSALKESVKAEEGDEAIQGKLDRLMALDREVIEMKQQAFENVSSELAPAQQAKLYVFLQDFENQMRRLVERARQHQAGFGKMPGPPEMPRAPGRFGPHDDPGKREDRTGDPDRSRRRGGPERGPTERGSAAEGEANPPEPAP